MATTFEEMLNEGLFDILKGISDVAMTAKGLAQGDETTKDRFRSMLGDQLAAGRLDTKAVLNDLHAAFKYYCGQQGLQTTAMAVVEFLATIRGEEQLSGDDNWMKWITGTPDIKLPAPDSKAINTQFGILVRKSEDDIATSKAVAKIAQLAEADEQDRMLINNWLRLLSMTKPDILRIKTVAPILRLLDRNLDPKELDTFFTMVARDMLRSKAVQDMAKSKEPKTAEAGGTGDKSTVNTNPKTNRTNFTVPIGKPTTPGDQVTPSAIMVDIRTLSQPLFRFLQSNQPGDVTQVSGLLAELLHQSRDVKLFSAMSARILALLIARKGTNDVVGLYAKARSTKVTDPEGDEGFVGQIISTQNIAALCDWIKLGGTLDEVTAEFTATISDYRNAALTTALLANMLKPQAKPA